MALPAHCLAVPSCGKPRLRYRGYCADHGPLTPPLPPTRCLAPVRCYCPNCRQVSGTCELPPPFQVFAQVRERGRRRHLEVVR